MGVKAKSFNSVMGKKYDAMIGRCYRKSDSSFKNYGTLGIRVCEAWLTSIDEFKSWFQSEMDRKGISKEEVVSQSRSIQLDRKDPFGHYTPENCRLATNQENIRNQKRRKSRIYETAEGTIVRL